MKAGCGSECSAAVTYLFLQLLLNLGSLFIWKACMHSGKQETNLMFLILTVIRSTSELICCGLISYHNQYCQD
ncbi:hypothetical protein WN944_021113 [Citrus x changshan-huyou]|uniref:Uncharacterized protein n=1 Tax=Citrus x changshan-huyou TaxID=2935761 RepID=A0AAP0QZG2_9ROSI